MGIVRIVASNRRKKKQPERTRKGPGCQDRVKRNAESLRPAENRKRRETSPLTFCTASANGSGSGRDALKPFPSKAEDAEAQRVSRILLVCGDIQTL